MPLRDQKFLIWGAKGHAKVLDEIIRLNHGLVVALADLDLVAANPLNGLPVLHGKQGYTDWLNRTRQSTAEFRMSAVAAIGGSRGRDRLAYLDMFRHDGFATPSLVHPRAHIADSAKIGVNCQVCAFAFIGAGASVGDACLINTKAGVDHESSLGDGVHIAPGATLCGCVEIGDFAFVGAGATILPNIKIGANAVIGAGALVTRDVPDNVLVYGNPAKIIREVKNA